MCFGKCGRGLNDPHRNQALMKKILLLVGLLGCSDPKVQLFNRPDLDKESKRIAEQGCRDIGMRNSDNFYRASQNSNADQQVHFYFDCESK